MSDKSTDLGTEEPKRFLFAPAGLPRVHPITDFSIYFSGVGRQFVVAAVAVNGRTMASVRVKVDGHFLQLIADRATVDLLDTYLEYDTAKREARLRQTGFEAAIQFLDAESLAQFVLAVERWVVSEDFGRFEFVRELDKGCFGSVKLMRDRLKNGKLVTLKVVAIPKKDDRDAMRSLLNEVQILRKIRHRNIVKMYSVLQDRATVSLIMEFIGGGTLESLFVQGTMDERESFRVARSLLQAVGEANKHFFVHRDIKPVNIMWKWSRRDQARVWKLIDFGLSENFTDFSENSLMRDRTGTVCYMAPEILDNTLTGGVYTELVDVYSVGIVLLELWAH